MNGLLIVVCGIILAGAFFGMVKGGVKIAVSLGATLLTMALVFAAAPYVGEAVCALTPADEVIEQKCLDTITNAFLGGEETQKLLDAAQISDDAAAQYIIDAEVPLQAQIAAIEGADIPDLFKNLLLDNNNSEVYQKLGATSFVEYISKYLTKLIIDMLSYLITFLVVVILLRIVIYALNLMAKLPVLGFLNRLSGLALGTVISLIIVGFLFVIITLLYSTSFGGRMLGMIGQNEILTFLYEHNLVMYLMTRLW